MDDSSSGLSRKRSTSTLANTISFTHTRINPEDETRQSNSKTTSPFNYMQKNNSSSTIQSIPHTLSNVGFNSVSQMTPITQEFPASTTSITSPNPGRKESKFTKAKMFARTKTKELAAKSKADNHSFLKINTHGHHGLSSSSSNSKVADSGSTMYSFDPSQILDKDTILKHVASESTLKNLGFDERDQIADNLWATITANLKPLFKVESKKTLKLKLPIEEMSKMVEMFLRLRIENNTSATSLISEMTEFLKNGFNILENHLSFNEELGKEFFYKLSVTWSYFFKNIYHYLLAIFSPLDAEFQGAGTIVRNPSVYWADFMDPSMRLSTKKLILAAFRDHVVIPYFEMNVNLPELDEHETRVLIQCFGMLKSLQSNTYNQRIVEHISGILEQRLEGLTINT